MEANNMKAMREALEYADSQLRAATEDDTFGDDVVYLVGCMLAVARACRAALAAPPRQCDIGTAEEQRRRYDEWRNHDGLRAALGKDEFEWAQMPYEEGGAE